MRNLKQLLIAIILCSAIVSLSGCLLKPYRIDIQQGNIITPANASKIHKGMSTQQVINQLGTPVLKNVYYDNTIVYIYTFRAGHKKMIKRYMIIYLKNNRVIDINADANELNGYVLPKP